MCKYRLKNKKLMVIVMNVDLADQTSRREGKTVKPEKKVCLDAQVSSGFTRRNDFGEKHDYFSPLCFFLYTGESYATRRQGTPPTRIIRRFFTSDKQAIWLSLGLFEENMFFFLQHTPGSPQIRRKKIDHP